MSNFLLLEDGIFMVCVCFGHMQTIKAVVQKTLQSLKTHLYQNPNSDIKDKSVR